MTTHRQRRGWLFAGLGAGAGVLGTSAALFARQAGHLEGLPSLYFAGAAAPPLLAAVGLAMYDRRPRLAAALVVLAAGSMTGVVVAGSSRNAWMYWLPAALLLIHGAHTLWTGAGRPPPPADQTRLAPTPSPSPDNGGGEHE